MLLGDRIRIARRRKGITAITLAKFLKISAPTYRNLENNKAFWGMKKLEKLINELELERKEMEELYCNQTLERLVTVKIRQENPFILIPAEIMEEIGREENTCIIFNNELKKITKEKFSYFLFLGRKAGYEENQLVLLKADLKIKKLTLIR